jgi:uncharacterized protein (DUF983 family)
MENREINKEVNDEIRCKKCGSTFTYIRFLKRCRVCRTCGYIENLEEVKE